MKFKKEILSVAISMTVTGSFMAVLVNQITELNSQKKAIISNDGFDISSPVNSNIDGRLYQSDLQNSSIKQEYNRMFEPTGLGLPGNNEFEYTKNGFYSSNNSKTLILNDDYFINFFKTVATSDVNSYDAKAPASIILHSKKGVGSKKINLLPGTRNVISAELIGNHLWIIADGTFDPNSGVITHKLMAYNVKNSEVNLPEVIFLDEITITPSVATSTNNPLVLSPTYTGNNASLFKTPSEILVWQQNTSFKDFSNKTNGIKKYKILSTNKFVVEEVTLPNVNLTDKVLAITTYNTNVGIHSSGKTSGVSFTDNFSTTQLSELVVQDVQTNIDNQLSYGKLAKNGNGFELFYVLPQIDNGIMFSLKLDENFKLDLIQPLPINLIGTDGVNKNISLINYGKTTPFDDGGINIPIRYQYEGGIEKQSLGLINWKETNNDEYWIQTNFSNDDKTNNISKDFLLNNGFFEGNPGFQDVYNSATINKITDTKISWYFQNKGLNSPNNTANKNMLFMERNLPDLKLTYKTKTPNEIVIEIDGENPSYADLEGSALKEEVLKPILSYSTDYPYISRSSTGIEIKEPITKIPGKGVIVDYKYSLGSYDENSDYIPASEQSNKQITLLQQPKDFFPLDFAFSGNLNQLPNDFSQEVKNIIGEEKLPLDWQTNDNISSFIGSLEAKKVFGISNEYLSFLESITTSGNDMTGELDIKMVFRGNNEKASTTLSFVIPGFYAQIYLIALVVPIIVVVLVIIFTIIFVMMHKKRKLALSRSIQAGFALATKMNSNKDYKGEISQYKEDENVKQDVISIDNTKEDINSPTKINNDDLSWKSMPLEIEKNNVLKPNTLTKNVDSSKVVEQDKIIESKVIDPSNKTIEKNNFFFESKETSSQNAFETLKQEKFLKIKKASELLKAKLKDGN